MERHKHMNSNSPRKTAFRLLTLLLVTAVCVSCGPSIIKGRPPFINISGMNLEENRLTGEFDISNQNGVPMTIEMIDITMTVNGVELARENRELKLLVGANSTEQVIVEELPDEFKRGLLDSLDSGEVKSLPFDLDGRVRTLEDGYLAFDQKGYLYPVPGKPGHFRSAVTQSKGLQREEPF
jgi:LEA14-like dessication related protein